VDRGLVGFIENVVDLAGACMDEGAWIEKEGGNYRGQDGRMIGRLNEKNFISIHVLFWL